jgi:hypothetical protein
MDMVVEVRKAGSLTGKCFSGRGIYRANAPNVHNSAAVWRECRNWQMSLWFMAPNRSVQCTPACPSLGWTPDRGIGKGEPPNMRRLLDEPESK